MDDDRVRGAATKVAGSLKEAVGKVTGDTKLQAEGTAQKAGGAMQDATGRAKAIARDAAGT